MSGEVVLYLRGMSPASKRRLAQLARASGRSLNRYAIGVLEEHAAQREPTSRESKRGAK